MVLRIRGNPTWDRRNQRRGTGKRMQLCYSSEWAFVRYANELTASTHWHSDAGPNHHRYSSLENRKNALLMKFLTAWCVRIPIGTRHSWPRTFRNGLNYLPLDGCIVFQGWSRLWCPLDGEVISSSSREINTSTTILLRKWSDRGPKRQ